MVDIIIVILLFLGIYLGHKRGLIMQLFYVGTMIIGLIVSMLFSTRLIPIPADVTTGLEGVYAGLNIPTAYYRIVSFVVLFIVIRLIIQIIASALGVIRKLPLIKTTDRLLGGIFGFVEVYLLIFVVLYFVTVLPLPEWKIAIFTNSTIPGFILENTPILSQQLIDLFFK